MYSFEKECALGGVACASLIPRLGFPCVTSLGMRFCAAVSFLNSVTQVGSLLQVLIKK